MSRDVRIHAVRQNAELRNGSAGEQIKYLQESGGGSLVYQLAKGIAVHAHHRDVRSELVNQQDKERIEKFAAQVGHPKCIAHRVYHLHTGSSFAL